MTDQTAQMRRQISQWAHNVKMTSYQRRCDVISSHRRWYDVILMLFACWVESSSGAHVRRYVFSRFGSDCKRRSCITNVILTWRCVIWGWCRRCCCRCVGWGRRCGRRCWRRWCIAVSTTMSSRRNYESQRKTRTSWQARQMKIHISLRICKNWSKSLF